MKSLRCTSNFSTFLSNSEKTKQLHKFLVHCGDHFIHLYLPYSLMCYLGENNEQTTAQFALV